MVGREGLSATAHHAQTRRLATHVATQYSVWRPCHGYEHVAHRRNTHGSKKRDPFVTLMLRIVSVDGKRRYHQVLFNKNGQIRALSFGRRQDGAPSRRNVQSPLPDPGRQSCLAGSRQRSRPGADLKDSARTYPPGSKAWYLSLPGCADGSQLDLDKPVGSFRGRFGKPQAHGRQRRSLDQ